MSLDIALEWARARTYDHREFGASDAGAPSVSVCLPARDEAATVGPIVAALVELRERGEVDEVVVLDAASEDGTASVARDAGATVVAQEALAPELGPVLGKGDAMWRALRILGGEIVCFLDADSGGFGPHFARGLVGPLRRDPGLHFVKGCYRRPFRTGGVALPDGGGRVNELAARPLLHRFYPELAAVRQPLAGEFAARRELLERLPFPTGYGVEIGLLIDAYREVGLDGLAQVHLGVRQNRHQPLHELGPMAYAILVAVTRRLEQESRLDEEEPDGYLVAGPAGVEPRELGFGERPPLASLQVAGR